MFEHGVFRAGGTIRVSRFVQLDTAADFTVVEGEANGRIHGIGSEAGYLAPLPTTTDDPPLAAVVGTSIKVTSRPGDTGYVRVGTGGVVRGGELESDADGQCVTAATTAATVRQIAAIALESASAGELCLVQLAKYPHTIPA